jgi:hypothetical protein
LVLENRNKRKSWSFDDVVICILQRQKEKKVEKIYRNILVMKFCRRKELN